MEKVAFLPLGSVVVVKGGVKKAMIISRGLGVTLGDGVKYFDYGGCLYPEGLVGDQVLYFNHADINKVVFEGFSDDDNELMVENINAFVQTSDLERGNPYELNKQNGKV